MTLQSLVTESGPEVTRLLSTMGESKCFWCYKLFWWPSIFTTSFSMASGEGDVSQVSDFPDALVITVQWICLCANWKEKWRVERFGFFIKHRLGFPCHFLLVLAYEWFNINKETVISLLTIWILMISLADTSYFSVTDAFSSSTLNLVQAPMP